MDIQSYLERINFQGPISVTREVLYELQKVHLLNIPFENLDIHYGIEISIEPTDIYQKIIVEKRGGFCYELNGLFHWLLKEIGFNAKLISARVFVKEGEYTPKYDHLAIIVTVEEQVYLVDVGFGKFTLQPLKLIIDSKLNDSFGNFQFDKFNSEYFRINEINNNELTPQYIFKLEECELSEFASRCQFHQTSNESHFSKKKLISIAKKEGRTTLNNNLLKITESGIEKEVGFKEEEFENMLKEYFGIEMGI